LVTFGDNFGQFLGYLWSLLGSFLVAFGDNFGYFWG